MSNYITFNIVYDLSRKRNHSYKYSNNKAQQTVYLWFSIQRCRQTSIKRIDHMFHTDCKKKKPYSK